MKKIAKKTVVRQLEAYVRKLRQRSQFKIVAVVGSIGKTSTKFAIAQVLREKFRVQFQEGNYNDAVTVPLVFFDLPEPSLLNPLAWAQTFRKIKKSLKQPYPYDVVVVELGTDGPGQIAAFADYVQADIAVVSAITPEHMEFFADLDAVASEELSVAQFSELVVANSDLADPQYLEPHNKKLVTFGKDPKADFILGDVTFDRTKASFSVAHRGKHVVSAQMEAVSIAELYSATAAVAVARQLGLSTEEIKRGIEKLKPVSGRMQRLPGIKNSLLIDETYNASPVAVRAALDSLYELKAPQKIAILGNMNELGDMSPAAHTEIGEYCEPTQLDVVVTIGPDANAYVAPAAKKQGCQVQAFDNPYDAGEYIKSILQENAVVLAKGSQNGVFAEEAIKLLLADPNDSSKLVRQSTEWLEKKHKQFKTAS